MSDVPPIPTCREVASKSRLCKGKPLLELLLHSQLRRVSALSLSAVCGTRWKTSVALSANLSVAVGLGSQHFERWLNDSSSETARAEGSVRFD
jgi:hypothetical protein